MFGQKKQVRSPAGRSVSIFFMSKRPNAYRKGLITFNEEEICFQELEHAQLNKEDELEELRGAKCEKRAKVGAAPKRPLATELNPEGAVDPQNIPEVRQDVDSRCDECVSTRDVIFPPLFNALL